jgi:chromosome segregation protein
VIESIEEASRAVNLLNEASKGRAHFFILKNFESSPEPAHDEIRGCIPAISIVDIDNRYRPLCNHLLKNVYIVTENQENTPYLQQDYPTAVFITQNGKYCSTRNSLSGGSVGLFDGKRIGRAKHLENLSTEIEALSTHLEVARAHRDHVQHDLLQCKQNKERMTVQKNRMQQELNEASHEFASLKSKEEHLESSIANSMKIIQDLGNQLHSIDDTLQQSNLTFQEHLVHLRAEHEVISARLADLQHQFNELTDVVNASSNEYNQHNINCIQQQNKISTIVRDQTYKNTLLDTLRNNIESNTAELEQVNVRMQELVESSSGFDAHLQQLYSEKEIQDQEVRIAETEYYKSRGFIDELETRIRQVRHQREQSEQLAQAIRERTMELKMQLNSLRERLSVEFGIDLNEIIDKEPSPELNEEELKEKVHKQKSQLDNYGPINPMAVEAFHEVKERYTFIITQKDDLLRAKESLLKTIEEIEITAKENFMKAFTRIRENFIHVFRSLFTQDDDCDLVLLDPSNPTESDVQIIAKPKGKRPLSISQLSGGEKTLTATALLFGIYLLKPAPFCIFDEVDAPLDDMNIDKFNNIIRKFSTDSQFIIITHNKRTMAATDIMYGITMIEQGVTQVVPVALTEMVEE